MQWTSDRKTFQCYKQEIISLGLVLAVQMDGIKQFCEL